MQKLQKKHKKMTKITITLKKCAIKFKSYLPYTYHDTLQKKDRNRKNPNALTKFPIHYSSNILL